LHPPVAQTPGRVVVPLLVLALSSGVSSLLFEHCS
jgi:hypothetical protein